MSFFEKQAELLRKSNESEQPEYETRRGRADGEGVLFEALAAALAFLRCVRRRLTFLLSSNDTAGGHKFDDLVITWQDEDKGQKEGTSGVNGAPTALPSDTRDEDSPSLRAVFVQQKYKTSPRKKTILFDHLTKKSEDFCIRNFYDCYVDIKDSLNGGNYALVVYTNSTLGEEVEHMFIAKESESFPWMELLESDGCVYKLNPDDEDVKRALEKGDDQFIPNFYLFCGQSNNESIKDKIRSELQLILAADESSSKTMCEDLCSSISEWMKKHKFYLRSDWKSWLNIVDSYIKKEVTTCNSIVTRIKYCNVEALQAFIESHNPAWIRPPGREAKALTATKVHQIIRDEKHIMVSVRRLSELEEKILHCWGPFCPWLVLVDDAEGSCDIQHHMMKHVGPDRRLIIVSHERDYSFLDTFNSDDICDDTWKALINVEIRLNSEQYSCRLGDLCETEALKKMLDENPEALATLSQLTGPVRMGQDLDPLPNNHIDRRLISRMHVREEFFSKLGDYDVCIMDKLSYNHLTNVSVNETVKFEELENYLCASNAVWPLFSFTDIIDLHVIQMICSNFQNMCVYVLSYEEDGWKILFLHRGSAKILPYVKEQSRSLWQIVDSLSSGFIVDGKPGIGKSTFLLDIANQVKRKNPSWWIVRINLLTYSEVFNSCSCSFEAVNKILLRVVYNEKNVGTLEYLLLQHCLKDYAHIICLVDGFDEICPDYAEKSLQALQQLAPRRGKLVVATRPSVTDRLEAAMGVLAHSLPAFTEEEVYRFHQRGKLGVNDVVVELLKIPLFSRMYAEALEIGIVVDDIVTLYETFFERKFRRLYGDKWGEDLSKPGMKRIFEEKRKKQENHLGFLALTHLLPKLQVPSAAQTPSIDREELVTAGVIYQFIDDKPVFIHRTFAEHFLAKWCLYQLAKGDRAKVYQTALSDQNLEFFVESFDRMASRGSHLLTAVLNGSESEVESLLQRGADPAERDEVGRNSLHLAAAYSRDSTLLWLLVNCLEVAGAESVGGSASGPAEETQEAVNDLVVYEKGENARLADKERTSQCVQVRSGLGLAEASGAAGLWAVAATGPVSAALGAEDALLQWTPLRYAAERRHWGEVADLLEAGAQPCHLGDFQRGLHDPQKLWWVFKEVGYSALLDHIRIDWRSLDIQVGVSIVCAEMSPEQYKEICSEAVRRGHWEVARLLHLKIGEMQNKCTSGGSPELQLNQGATLKPRHEAGLGGSKVKKLKEKEMGSTEERQTAAEDYADGWTELQRAVAAGDVAGVRRLVEAGADVDMQDNEGRTAMHLAALAGCVHCMEPLLSAGAAVNMEDEEGRTALHRAAEEGRRQAVRLLLAAGADAIAQGWAGETPLHVAADTGNAECARLMARAIRTLQLKNMNGLTALHRAAGSGDVASVKVLLAAGADTSAVGRDLWTPLHWAAVGGHSECVRLLLQARAGVAAKDKWGATALHCAAWSGSPESVRLLLEAGARVQEEDGGGNTPLHWASRYGAAACIRLLLREGANVQQRNRKGETVLHCAAWRGHAQGVRLLLDAGADALAQDMRGMTALHCAARRGSPDCVRLLLEAGADIQETDEDGSTPLHWAAGHGHRECVRLLLQAGADVAAKDRWGATTLHCKAVWRRNPDCVRLLLQAGADLHEKDRHGDTPLHCAALYGRAACIMLLLQQGADVHQRNREGETPLHRAARRGEAASVRLLLEAGADALAQDRRGQTPLQVVAGWQPEECLSVLNSAVAHRQPTAT